MIKKIDGKKAKIVKVNLYNWFDKINLAAQRIALIEKALLIKDAMNVDEAFDFIIDLSDDDDGEFILEDFDGYSYRSSGRVRVEFHYEEGNEKLRIIPEIFYELD